MRFSRSESDDRQDAVCASQPLTGPAMLLKSMLGIDPNMIMQAISEIMAGVKAMNEALARIEAQQEAFSHALPSRLLQDDREPLQRDINTARVADELGKYGLSDCDTGSEG